MSRLPIEMLIGIDELDCQHQAFFDLLMRLQESTEKNYGYATAAILAELAVQIRIHFSVEESLMRVLDYPEVEAHVGRHLELAKHLQRFQRQAQDHALATDISGFIQRWLNEHVSAYDRRFAEFFKARLTQTN